jgi:hypothetical protein
MTESGDTVGCIAPQAEGRIRPSLVIPAKAGIQQEGYAAHASFRSPLRKQGSKHRRAGAARFAVWLSVLLVQFC